MNGIDLWSLLTGIVSILSLILAAGDKFPQLKKYLYTAGFFLSGFAVGRISPVISSITSLPHSAGFLIIILIFAILITVYFIIMTKANQPVLAYLGVLFIFFIALNPILKTYSDFTSRVTPNEYLLLAKVYEQKNDVDNAIKYFERCLDATDDYNEKQILRDKINILKKNRISAY